MKFFSITFPIIMIVVTGCASKSHIAPPFVIKNLDSVDRMLLELQSQERQKKNWAPQQRIVIRTNPHRVEVIPYFTPLSKDLRLIIDPKANLGDVACYLKLFEFNRRLEFWTTHGIFIVSAPRYVEGRMGGIGSNIAINVEYANNKYIININAQHVIQKKTNNLSDSIAIIFKAIKNTEPHSFVNVSFFLPSNAKWSSVELIMAKMFERIDSLRGFWVGPDKNNMIKIHFHDIYEYGCSPPTQRH